MKKNQKKNKTNSSSKTKVKNSSKDLKKSLDLISIELEDYKDKNLRLLAEFENFKKRSEQNISDSYNRSIKEIILSFLPVVDDIERIINNKSTNDTKILIDSILMTKDKIIKILDNYNVTSFESLGNVFDPDLHEAIMAQDSSKKTNEIINEFEKGYKLKDEIIRHSKVIVSKGKK